ncbi:MAG: hypothetical protein AAGK05_06335 [Pseudomonadota bacterium]
MKKVGVTREEMETITKAGLRSRSDERSRREWRDGMERKSSLRYYAQHKVKFGMETWWRTTEEEKVMRWFQAGVVMVSEERRERCGRCASRDSRHILFGCGETEHVRRRFGIGEEEEKNIIFIS